ncbi:MAG: hypothetical protein IKX80_04475 [Lachnospiraceae bacterium]|jgi:hypothetical protein|nr:hypothetical protein [Clostridiales bacterium]MBR5732678.1 hypothetical protein [Lachnospiraceae bacterium]
MKDDDNMLELDIDQLEEVTGGVTPHYPTNPGPAIPKIDLPVPGTGTGTNSKSKIILNNINNGVISAEGAAFVKPFEVCPKCGSTAVSFNREENICMCQDCGYCEDRSK